MIKILRKNQIVIFAIALMLVTAGYLNYTMNQAETAETSIIYDTEEYAGIGDARLVSTDTTSVSNSTENNVIQNSGANTDQLNTENTVVTNSQSNTENSTEKNITESTSSAVSSGDTKKYFQESRLERDNMYSEMLETYQTILANTSIASEQKIDAQNKISTINSEKNSIMIAENLIKNKGFDEVVIFVNNESVSVVVMADSLNEAEIAQVQSIVERELGAQTDNIHISNK